jgi:hypothetical protein
MVSTFNLKAYLSILAMMIILIAIIIIALLIDANIADILIFTVFGTILISFILYEFRNKIISILITNNQISKSSYFALDKIYDFKEFDGFQTRVIKGKFKNYECLYLLRKGTRVISLSQLYHKNYDELKTMISEKSKNLGPANYDLFDKITEIVLFDM